MKPAIAVRPALAATILAVLLPALPAHTEPDSGVLEVIEDAVHERWVQWEDVTMVEITKRAPSNAGFVEWKELYEQVIDEDGNSHIRQIPPDEIQRRLTKANTGKAPNEMAQFLQAYAVAGVALGAAAENEFAKAMPGAFGQSAFSGMGGNTVKALANNKNTVDQQVATAMLCGFAKEYGDAARSSPWPTWEEQEAEKDGKGNPVMGGDVNKRRAGWEYYTSPLVMMSENACFLMAASFVISAENADVTAETKEVVEETNKALEVITYGGQEEINGTTAHKISVTDVEHVEETEAGTVSVLRMDRWIDAEHYGDVRMRMEATLESEGTTREIFFERDMTDYRNVPGSNMIVSYKTTVRMGGVLSDEDRAKLAANQAQMAQLEEQLASIPPDQRAMMEQMLGSQLAQMKSLVDDGTYATEYVTTNVVINPDLKIDPANKSGPMSETDLLIRIQRDLDTLGYDPGNTIGNLSRETVAAIISFQKDNDLELTGKPSPQLAGILAARVAAKN